MDIQGKILVALPPRNGESARGPWTAQDFVVETHDSYPKKMVFTVFGADRLQRFNIQVGQEVLVSFDIDAHEYQGRWYNSIRAYDVRPFDPANAVNVPPAAPFPPAQGQVSAEPFPPVQPQAPAQQPANAPAQDPFAQSQGDSVDDLPF